MGIKVAKETPAKKAKRKGHQRQDSILWKVRGQGEGKRKEGGLVEEKRMIPMKP